MVLHAKLSDLLNIMQEKKILTEFFKLEFSFFIEIKEILAQENYPVGFVSFPSLSFEYISRIRFSNLEINILQ